MWALVITEWKLSPERVAAFFSITTATHQNTTSSPSPLPLPQRKGSEQRVIPIYWLILW